METIFDIEHKEDSAEKLAAMEGKDPKNFMLAQEFNLLLKSAQKSEAKFIPWNEKFVFKLPSNLAQTQIESGDTVIGNVGGTFIIGQYTGDGDEDVLSNYLILLKKEDK